MGDDPEERRETIALVIDELDRMARFVDDLLTLAKAERPDFLASEAVDVDELTDELVAKAAGPRAARLGAARRALGQVARRPPAPHQALLKPGPERGRSTPATATDRARLALSSGEAARSGSRDNGPGMPAADRERGLRALRARRPRPRRSDGAGLGLAIVRPSPRPTAAGSSWQPARRRARASRSSPGQPPRPAPTGGGRG